MSCHVISDTARRHRISSSSWVHGKLSRRVFSKAPWTNSYSSELFSEAPLAFLDSSGGVEPLLRSVALPVALLGGL